MTIHMFVPYLREAKERLNFVPSNHFERRTTREWQGYRIRLQLNFASTRWLGDAHFVVVFVTLCLGASLHPFSHNGIKITKEIQFPVGNVSRTCRSYSYRRCRG